MPNLAMYIGAIIGTWLLVKGAKWLLRFTSMRDPVLSVVATFLVVVLAVIGGAFGRADGGVPNYLPELVLYIPAGLLVLCVELFLQARGRLGS